MIPEQHSGKNLPRGPLACRELDLRRITASDKPGRVISEIPAPLESGHGRRAQPKKEAPPPPAGEEGAIVKLEPSRRDADAEPSTGLILLHWLPKCNSMRTRPGWVEPEIYFRIVHLAQAAHSCAPVAAYREQTVEIALGPKGAFVNGNFGALTRRAPPGQVVSAVPPGRGDPKPPLEPKTPRVVELLRKANEWNALLESGTIASQAAIARREGVTRARVTQIMGLLRLAPEIQEKILSSPGTLHCRYVTERMLRPIGAIADQRDQLREFQKNIM